MENVQEILQEKLVEDLVENLMDENNGKCNGKYVGDKTRFTGFVKSRPCFALKRRRRIRERKNNC